MAMGFFRKRQKLIIVIMVALMVSFLVGMQGFTMLTSKGRSDFPLGKTRLGELSLADSDRADSDLRLLQGCVYAGSREFQALMMNNERAQVAYALLVQQAQEEDGSVSEAELKNYLETVGVSGAQYQSLLKQLSIGRKVSESGIRDALRRWIQVVRVYQATEVTTPPSANELMRAYRDMKEEVGLRVVEIPASDFMDKVQQPTEKEITDFFNKYAAMPKGQYSSANPFGFGYRQPSRVQVSYLLVDRDTLSRVTEPSPARIRQYWRQNQGEFTKKVPKEAPAPKTDETTKKPETEKEVETVDVPMTLEEAWSQIADKLRDEATEKRLAVICQQVTKMLGEEAGSRDPYKAVVSKLTESAGSTLRAAVPASTIASLRGKTLEQGMALLAKAANIKVICYPWETLGEYSVNRDVLIPDTLDASRALSLGAALDAITSQVLSAAQKDKAIPASPKIEWAFCSLLPGVLLPTGPEKELNLFLVRAGNSGLVDGRQLSSDSILGSARPSVKSRRTLAMEAFSAAPFVDEKAAEAAMKVGSKGRMMVVGMSGEMGRLFWTLDKAEPTKVLKTPNKEVRKQIIEDVKTSKAFTMAGDLARKLKDRANKEGLEKIAQELKTETKETGLFTRRPTGPYAQYLFHIKGIDLPNLNVRNEFAKRVFEDVVPEDPDQVKPDQAGQVSYIPVNASKAVYLVQRIKYSPAVIGEFETEVRTKLVEQSMRQQRDASAILYFRLENVVKRMEYEPARPE